MTFALLTVGLLACNGAKDPDDIPASTPTGELVAYLDATEDTETINELVEEVWLRFEDVLVHSEDEGWVTIGDDRRDLDLMPLRGGAPLHIGGADIYEGAYDAMRLIIADSWIIVDGEQLELTIARVLDMPGDGFDFGADFFVDEGVTTSVLLNWDLDTQLANDADVWTLHTDAVLNVELE
jgi:hypothetical protein